MDLFLVVHTENKEKLRSLFEKISKHPEKPNISLAAHSKGYAPWQDPDLMSYIINFKTYSFFPTEKSRVPSVVEIISKIKSGRVLLIDEDSEISESSLCSLNLVNYEFYDIHKKILCADVIDLIKLNLDTKYQTLKWFTLDLFSQKLGNRLPEDDGSDDAKRYLAKINSPLFSERIVYVDGGMGDHVMSLPLLEKISKDCYICCKYPFVYEHLEFKGYVNWHDDLFGGYDRFVYSYGSNNNSPTIIDAFFGLYCQERESSDILKYNGKREDNPEIPLDRKVALICTSAARIGGVDSNKNWKDIRWLKLINELKKMEYFVIQVGSKSDNQIPNVDLKFLDRPLANLAKLIDDSSLWISVDTFFHHFASSIKPEVGICLTPFYNDHAKHPGVTYIEKDCGKDYSYRRWWLDAQQHERKECMDLIQLEDVLEVLKPKTKKIKVKIYCNNHNFDNPSNWRCYMQYHDIDGIDFEFSSVFDFNLENDIIYDVVMLIRPLYGFIDYIRLLKSNGVKVAVDYDDPLPLSFEPSTITEHILEIVQIIKESDLVITTNQNLKNYYYHHSFNESIKVIPNMIDDKSISKTKKDNGNKIVLGWFGNSGHYENLKLIYKPVLKILDEYDNVYLNIYSDSDKIFDLFDHPKTNKIQYVFNFKEFQESIGDIDINLAPLTEDYFNLYKSNIRIILTGYKGIPSVASNFSEYKLLGKNNVVLCDGEDDWYLGMKKLIDDVSFRKEIANNIQSYINENLSFDKWKGVKKEMFSSIVKK